MAETAEDMDESSSANQEVKTGTKPVTEPSNDTEEQAHPKESDLKTTSTHSNNSKRNAFSELMTPKPTKQSKHEHQDDKNKPNLNSKSSSDPFRSGLLPYITHPERFSSAIVRVTEHSVLIRDKFPKSTVHLLLLPRMQYASKLNMNPRDALSHDKAFLEIMQQETDSAVRLAASELERLLGAYSASSRARNAALDADEELPETLPAARDWIRDVRSGVHAHPSMSHMHIHILSVDMHSEALKHRKHYNSFNTGFFIEMKDFPLQEDDERWRTSVQNENLRRDFKCWRCGKGFGNRFKELKAHLEQEFEEWKRE